MVIHVVPPFPKAELLYSHDISSDEKTPAVLLATTGVFIYCNSFCNFSVAFKFSFNHLIFGEHEKIVGPRGLEKTINYMKNRIDFNVMSDNIVPYISIGFEEFGQNPVKEIWLGPKNMISEQDLKLYLRKYNYLNMGINMSRITFI